MAKAKGKLKVIPKLTDNEYIINHCQLIKVEKREGTKKQKL